MAAIGEVENLAAATVRSLMREGGASIVVGSMMGSMAEVLTWCGIKIFEVRPGVGRRYSHLLCEGYNPPRYFNLGGATTQF